MSEGKHVGNESEESKERSESKFRQALKERGKLKPVTKPKPEGEFTPIEVEGTLLSEIIIEDRK